jgi:nucleoside-diphosphate-sugar epimerase
MASNGSRVLVVGGAGYIGSALLPRLLERDYSVRIIDLLLFGREPISTVLGHPRLEIIEADFRREDSIRDALKGVEIVIHLGGLVGDPACALDERLTVEINLLATERIAELARRAGVHRLIFASSCSVYGAGDTLLDEASAPNPISLYAETKVASELLLQRMASSEFAPVILRFGTTFGFSGRTRFDLVVNLLAAKALVEGKITVIGGNQWRPFIHVQDAAQAALLALEAPSSQVADQVFNVGSDLLNYTILQVGEAIRDAVPTAELLVADAGADRRDYRVSFAKIRDKLGFTPQWTLSRGIEQVLEAIRTRHVDDYRDARYNNAKFLIDEGLGRLRQTDGPGFFEAAEDTTFKHLPAWAGIGS